MLASKANLRRGNGDAQHWAHHTPKPQNLLHQAPHCMGRAGTAGRHATEEAEAEQAMGLAEHSNAVRRAIRGRGLVCVMRQQRIPSPTPESTGMAKPMPELDPLPVGSAMAVLMPMRRPRLSSSGPPAGRTSGSGAGYRLSERQRAQTAGAGRQEASWQLTGSSSGGRRSGYGRQQRQRQRQRSPELPGLMAASHWMTLRREVPPAPQNQKGKHLHFTACMHACTFQLRSETSKHASCQPCHDQALHSPQAYMSRPSSTSFVGAQESPSRAHLC